MLAMVPSGSVAAETVSLALAKSCGAQTVLVLELQRAARRFKDQDAYTVAMYNESAGTIHDPERFMDLLTFAWFNRESPDYAMRFLDRCLAGK